MSGSRWGALPGRIQCPESVNRDKTGAKSRSRTERPLRARALECKTFTWNPALRGAPTRSFGAYARALIPCKPGYLTTRGVQLLVQSRLPVGPSSQISGAWIFLSPQRGARVQLALQ